MTPIDWPAAVVEVPLVLDGLPVTPKLLRVIRDRDARIGRGIEAALAASTTHGDLGGDEESGAGYFCGCGDTFVTDGQLTAHRNAAALAAFRREVAT